MINWTEISSTLRIGFNLNKFSSKYDRPVRYISQQIQTDKNGGKIILIEISISIVALLAAMEKLTSSLRQQRRPVHSQK